MIVPAVCLAGWNMRQQKVQMKDEGKEVSNWFWLAKKWVFDCDCDWKQKNKLEKFKQTESFTINLN